MTKRELRFLLTPDCNFRCGFCHEEGLRGTYKTVDLIPEDVVYLFEVCRDGFGWKTLTLTGGEPTMFPGIRKTCLLLKHLGAKTTMVTNGSALSARLEMMSHLSQLNVSLHTMNPQIYSQIIGVQFPHKRLLNNILEVRSAFPELPIHLNCTISHGINDSRDEIAAILRFARSVDATTKFIELTTENIRELVSVDFLKQTLQDLGYVSERKVGLCEYFSKCCQKTIISRCDFGEALLAKKRIVTRDVFIASDGTIRPYANENIEISLLEDIRKRNTKNILSVIATFYT